MKKYTKSEINETNKILDMTRRHYSDADLIEAWQKEGFIEALQKEGYIPKKNKNLL